MGFTLSWTHLALVFFFFAKELGPNGSTTVCGRVQAKKYGGLGILNSKLMNVALLTKWIWRLNQNESGLWADMLRAKYFPDGNLFPLKPKVLHFVIVLKW